MRALFSRLMPALVLALAATIAWIEWQDQRYLGDALNRARETAVAQARGGERTAALNRLRRLMRVAPHDAGLQWDYITILSWDGQYRQAADLAAHLPLQDAPDYVHRALRDAYRALGQTMPAVLAQPSAVQDAASLRAVPDAPALAHTPAFTEAVPAPRRAPLRSVVRHAPRDEIDYWLDAAAHDAAVTESDFRERLIRYPDNLRLRADLAIWLARRGRLDEGLAVVGLRSWSQYAAYVPESFGSLLRKAGRSREAALVYAEGVIRYPERASGWAGLILALADHDDTLDKAEMVASRLDARLKAEWQVQEALAWLDERQGRSASAAQRYRWLRTVQGEHHWWFQREVLALADARLHVDALALARQQPEQVGPALLTRLVGDHATWTYWLAMSEEDPHRRWLDAAADELERFCAHARDQDNRAELARCHATRIRLFSNRLAHARAVAAYADARDDGIGPDLLEHGAHQAAVTSHLALFDMTGAMDAAQYVPELPLDQLAQIELYRERPQRAIDLLEQHNEEHAPFIWSSGGDRYRDNGFRLALERKLLLGLSWDSRLPEAQARLEDMHAAAPRNIDIRLQLAQVLRWRGWADRADEEYARAEALEPNNLWIQRERFSADMDRRAYRSAAHRRLWLSQRLDREEVATFYEDRRWRTDTGARLHASFSGDSGNDVGPGGSGHERVSHVALHSPAWTRFDDTRAFIAWDDIHAHWDGSEGEKERLRLGLRAGNDDREIEVAAVRRLRELDGTRLNLALSRRLSDRWRIGAALQGDSDAASVRAEAAGISARSARVEATWSVESGHFYGGSVQRAAFSDDNDQLTARLFARQHLLRESGRHQWGLWEDFWYVSNGIRNRPYYSPEWAFNGLLRLEYIGRLSTLFERRWHHHVLAGFGYAREADHGSAPIWDLRYTHYLQVNRHFTFGLGGRIYRRVWDGRPETHETLFGELTWRWQ